MFSSSLGFVICPESSSPFLTLSAEEQKKEHPAEDAGNGKQEMESWQEKSCQHTLNCLKPSAEREAGLIVSGMSAMERKQKWRQNYIEIALETNFRPGNTIPSTRGDLCSCFSG